MLSYTVIFDEDDEDMRHSIYNLNTLYAIYGLKEYCVQRNCFYPTSSPSGNQVDGLPLVCSLLHLRLYGAD